MGSNLHFKTWEGADWSVEMGLVDEREGATLVGRDADACVVEPEGRGWKSGARGLETVVMGCSTFGWSSLGFFGGGGRSSSSDESERMRISG